MTGIYVSAKESVEYMEASLRIEPVSEDCWRVVYPSQAKEEEPEYERACSLSERGEEHQAFFILREIAKRCPAFIAVQIKLAEIHSSRGNYKAAFKHYHKATSIGREALPEGFLGMLPWEYKGNHAFLNALFGLAIASIRLGKNEQGAELLKRLLELDPADTLGAGEALQTAEIKDEA